MEVILFVDAVELLSANIICSKRSNHVHSTKFMQFISNRTKLWNEQVQQQSAPPLYRHQVQIKIVWFAAFLV